MFDSRTAHSCCRIRRGGCPAVRRQELLWHHSRMCQTCKSISDGRRRLRSAGKIQGRQLHHVYIRGTSRGPGRTGPAGCAYEREFLSIPWQGYAVNHRWDDSRSQGTREVVLELAVIGRKEHVGKKERCLCGAKVNAVRGCEAL